jgi:hypothetical protein
MDSTRYYRYTCHDMNIIFFSNGPDDREDPEEDDVYPCIVMEHPPHSIYRISWQQYESLRDQEDAMEWGLTP